MQRKPGNIPTNQYPFGYREEGGLYRKVPSQCPSLQSINSVSWCLYCLSYTFAPWSFPYWMIQRHPVSTPTFPVSCIHYASTKQRNTKNSSFGGGINRAKSEIKVQMLTQNEANISQETQTESKILQCRKKVTSCVKIIRTKLLGWVMKRRLTGISSCSGLDEYTRGITPWQIKEDTIKTMVITTTTTTTTTITTTITTTPPLLLIVLLPLHTLFHKPWILVSRNNFRVYCSK